MKESQRRYLEEYEKYKHIVIELGRYQRIKSDGSDILIGENATPLLMDVVKIDGELVEVVTVHSSASQKKTLHWCRKNLRFIEPLKTEESNID